MFTDNIAAIATAVGPSSIAVIRISGPTSVKEVNRIFKGRTPLTEGPSHHVYYGHIVDQTEDCVDEVLVTVMKGPNSFTREDVVEINTHGGVVSVNRVMSVLLTLNIRLAEPGEFTKRAFLMGRIDLSQAEAVMDLIQAKSELAQKLALRQVRGTFSQKVKNLRQQLVELLAHMAVNIDYPEHDVQEVTQKHIDEVCASVSLGITSLLQYAQEGKKIKEGITTAILGRPNVGKSSLLNLLTMQEKAIVTEIPGTTRDIIEESVSLAGVPLRLLDTAGIRKTSDHVEEIGVKRSYQALQEADLIFMVLNRNEPIQEADQELFKLLKEKQVIVIINKSDLAGHLEEKELLKFFDEEEIVRISTKTEVGLEELRKKVKQMFIKGEIDTPDFTYASNLRQVNLLKKVQMMLADVKGKNEEGCPIDFLQIDLQESWECLGEVLGESLHDSLLDQIFSQFCLGK